MTNRQLIFIGLGGLVALFLVFFVYAQMSASKKYEACVADNIHRKQPTNLSFEIQQACKRISKAKKAEDKNAAQCTLDALLTAKGERSVPAAGNIVRACEFIEIATSDRDKEILKCVIERSVDHPIGRSYNYFYERCEKEKS